MAANDEPTLSDVTFVLPVRTYDPQSLLMLECWTVPATAEDGSTVELFRSWNGGAIIIEVTKPDGTKVKQAITIADLVNVWFKTV